MKNVDFIMINIPENKSRQVTNPDMPYFVAMRDNHTEVAHSKRERIAAETEKTKNYNTKENQFPRVFGTKMMHFTTTCLRHLNRKP